MPNQQIEVAEIAGVLKSLVLAADPDRADAMYRGEDTGLTPYERETAAEDIYQHLVAAGWRPPTRGTA